MSLRRRSTAQDELLPASRQNLGEPPPRRRRRRAKPLVDPRKLFRYLAFACLLPVVAYAAVALAINGDRLRPRVEALLSAETGRHVAIRSLTFSVRRLSLIAEDITVTDDPAFGDRVPFLQAQSMDLRVKLIPLLLTRAVRITAVTLDSPLLMLRQGPAGAWNYYSLIRASNRSIIELDPPSLTIVNGRLSVSSLADDTRLLQLRDINLTSPALSLQVSNRFALAANVEGGGALKLDGRVGPMEWDTTGPIVPLGGLLHIAGLSLAQSKLLSSSDSVAGQLDVDASIDSDGRVLRMDGQAKVEKLRLSTFGQPAPDELEAVFTLSHDLNTHGGFLNRCDFRSDKGSIALTGKYSAGVRSLLLNLDLAISDAPATNLAPFLPALGFPLPASAGLVGGSVVGDLKVEGPLDSPVLSGDLMVNGARMTGFDLSQRLAPIEGLDASDLNTEIEIVSWKSHLKTGAMGLHLDDLYVAITGLGSLSGVGVISPDGTLAFRMSGIRGLTGPKGTPIPFAVLGTCDNPQFRPGR